MWRNFLDDHWHDCAKDAANNSLEEPHNEEDLVIGDDAEAGEHDYNGIAEEDKISKYKHAYLLEKSPIR
jgi:hypothetical protein